MVAELEAPEEKGSFKGSSLNSIHTSVQFGFDLVIGSIVVAQAILNLYIT